MKKIVFIFFIFLSIKSYSQNDFGSLAVLIQTNVGSGSGFYLGDSTTESLYLVTACHVLLKPDGNLQSDSILIISYKSNSQSNAKDSFQISLLNAFRMKMFKFDASKDVAVVLIAKTAKHGISYQPFVNKISQSNTYLNISYTANMKTISQLTTMDDIYTVGYPRSLTLTFNFDFDRPLIRKGIIAGIDFQKKKVIADLPVYQGNSGGIVVSMNLLGGQPDLVGLVSQFVPFEEHWKSEAYGYYNTTVYNSGYAVIVPVDNIKEQILLIGK